MYTKKDSMIERCNKEKETSMKVKKVIALVMLALLMMGDSGQNLVQAAKYEKSTGVSEDYLATEAKIPKISAESAILMDARTGEILFQKNATKKQYPASITKCMTSLVAIENNDLNDVIEYSDNAVFSIEPGSSNVGIDSGEKLTVDQSLYGAMLESANECCNALAEKTAGSVEAFADLMNQRAQQIGCVNTHFANANGLYQKDHYTCAYDMALITREGMKNEDWRRYAGTISYQGAPKNKKKEKRYWNNHHKLLNGNLSYDTALYTVGGGKTGYTVKCKNTLVTFAKSNNDELELICVLMRSNKYQYVNGRATTYTYEDTKNLLNWGFQNFSTISSTVDVGQMNAENVNYFTQTYEMLQPEKFIQFRAENDCKIAISNSYDATKLKGNLLFAGDTNTQKWGTYQFVSSGNVIASTDVYYTLQMDAIKSLYGRIGKRSGVQIAKDTIFMIGIHRGVKRRKNRGFQLYGNSGRAFLRSNRRSMRRKKIDYGYIDYNSRKRKKRYSKKNKLHF